MSVEALLLETSLNYARHLVMCAEPVKALRVLDNVPVSIQFHPKVLKFREDLTKQIDQFFSDDAYIRRYTVYDNGGTPNQPFSDANLMRLFRAEMTVDQARAHKPKHVLSVGGGEGSVAKAILTATSAQLTTSELLGVGGDVNAALEKLFPGRTSVTGRLDVGEIKSEPKYDFIEVLEVVEHVTDDLMFLKNLRAVATDRCCLCLSTPNSTDWIETKLVDDFSPTNWYHHVRAYSPRSLATVLRKAGWVPTILYVEKTLYVVAHPGDVCERPYETECSWDDIQLGHGMDKIHPANVQANVLGRPVQVMSSAGALLVS
jgi:2-polyprenyl-3-methyl-5-hydroxy-6-metoxy-1,4-benzoquinol methylase